MSNVMKYLILVALTVSLFGCDKIVETRTQQVSEFEGLNRCVLRTDMEWGTYLSWSGELKTGYHPEKVYGVQNALYRTIEKTVWYESGEIKTAFYDEMITKLEACREDLRP